jgi:hypothetical protein
MENVNHQIEKHVPASEKRVRGRAWRELLSRMEIGDSVVLDNRNHRSSIKYAAQKLGIQLTSQTLPDKRIRVWRIA